MDRLKACRERGICLHIPPNHFETKSYHVILADGPGDRSFIRNMITGTSQVLIYSHIT
jgi:translation elongation factor EF-1alpha